MAPLQLTFIWGAAVVLLCLFTPGGAEDTNLALGQPTWQSSTLLNFHQVDQVADHAVDGNTASDFYEMSCTHTTDGDQPWWVVDLGDVYKITSVTITNRGDCCDQRLADFNIALMSSPPNEVKPSPDVYDIIYHQTGAVGKGETRNFPSDDTTKYGRYLVIQLLGNIEPLTLCEVEVFGVQCVSAWKGDDNNCEMTSMWQSEWMTLRSQAGSDSFLEISHHSNRLPVKGKAMIRPIEGSNAGHSFEALGSGQWDDGQATVYCGVVFVYNETHARLGAPVPYNGDHGGKGHIFCAGQPGWSDADGNAQTTDEAEVKVVLWFEEAFPTPDVVVDWTAVDSTDPDKVYFEFPNPTGEVLAFLTMQVRVQDNDGVTWISQGIGSDNSPDPLGNTRIGGVIYGHNEDTIRVWVRKIEADDPNEKNSVVNVEHGWGFSKQPTQTQIQARTGDVRLFGWKSETMGDPLMAGKAQFHLIDLKHLIGNIGLADAEGLWDPDTSLVCIHLTPRHFDGPNTDFKFDTTAAMMREEWDGAPHTGVLFGYSETNLRLFYPTGTDGCFVRIGPTAGNGDQEQCSVLAELEISIYVL